MSKETFKAFARNHPELATSVLKIILLGKNSMKYMKSMVKAVISGILI